MYNSNKHDYYAILELSHDASEQDIKRAFRRLAMKYHPDRNKAPGAEEKFKEISEAYEILSTPEKRQSYDTYGFTDDGGEYYQDPFENFNPYDIYNNFFSHDSEEFTTTNFSSTADFSSTTQTFSHKKSNKSEAKIICKITLSTWELKRGCKKKVAYNRLHYCKSCDGTGAKNGKKITCDVCDGSGKANDYGSFDFLNDDIPCKKCMGTGSIPIAKCKVCDGKAFIKTTCKDELSFKPGLTNGERVCFHGKGNVTKNKTGDLIIKVYAKKSHVLKRTSLIIIFIVIVLVGLYFSIKPLLTIL